MRPLGSQGVIERDPGVSFEPVRLPVFGFGALDRASVGSLVEMLNVKRDHLAHTEGVLDEETHQERVLDREGEIAWATLAVNVGGSLFQPQCLCGRDGGGHGLLRTLARRLALLGAHGVDIAPFLVAVAADRESELIICLADGPDLVRQVRVGPDRGEAQIHGADGVALLPQPSAVAEDQWLVDARAGGGIVGELLDAAVHPNTGQVGGEVQQVEALASARIGRALLMVFLKRVGGELTELLCQ